MTGARMKVSDPLGLHLRPAGDLCRRAMDFRSEIHIKFRNRDYNAKSLLGILSACITAGDEIELVCDGPDENEALAALCRLLEGKAEDH